MEMNFDMDKLQVVTQEMFDSWCEKAKNGPVKVGEIIIDNCLIDGIILSKESMYSGTFVTFIFENCYIKSIRADETFKASKGTNINVLRFKECKINSVKRDIINNVSVYFDCCEINNILKINGYSFNDFKSCEFILPIPGACPKNGEFIGYKKCDLNSLRVDSSVSFGYYKQCIVKLFIPSDAKRVWVPEDFYFSNRNSVKCRCDKAKVLGIYDTDGNEIDHNFSAISKFVTGENTTIYKVGEWIYPDSFDDSKYEACSHGIHFFMKFEDAVNY